MFIKKSSEFDADLVKDYSLILTANEENEAHEEECEEKHEEEEKKELGNVDKLQKAVGMLNDVCAMLEDDEKYKKVCKKIMKAIKLLGKVAEGEIEEVNTSEDVEKEVQEEIEEQKAE